MTRPPVVNLRELTDARERVREPHYRAKHYAVATRLGLTRLGLNVTELAPGSRSFPYHFHYANEELFFVLEGEGTLRWAGGQAPLRVGDFVGCVTGAAGAHQIINTGSVPLRYLAPSTTKDPEVVEYPDAGKMGATAGRRPGMSIQDTPFVHWGYRKHAVDYWDGEE
jgi:uncharacterized cupin superfamily protein